MIAFDSLHLWSDGCWGHFPHVFFVQNLQDTREYPKVIKKAPPRKSKNQKPHNKEKPKPKEIKDKEKNKEETKTKERSNGSFAVNPLGCKKGLCMESSAQE